MNIAIAFHILSVVIWVGGMFFAYMVLRPAAGQQEPPMRLSLWNNVFSRFFPWVWLAIIGVLASGYWLLLGPFGGFAKAPVYIHIMNTLGIIMMLIYMHVFFAPYRRLSKAVANSDWALAGKKLAQIRILVGINLALGILTILVATVGKTFLI